MMPLQTRLAGPFRVLGGTREQADAVREAIAAIPPRFAERASTRLATIRLDARDIVYADHDAANTPDNGTKTVGTYVQDFGIAYVRPDCAPWTVWHEIGHALDASLASTPGDRKWSTGSGFLWWSWCVNQADFPSVYAETSPSENFAERFAEYIAARSGIGCAERALAQGWHRRAPAFLHLIGRMV